MSWVYLFLAIFFELVGTTSMKLSNGMSKIVPTIGMFVSYFLCLSILSLALKKIDISVAYAIWAAVGIVIISIIGIVLFKEKINTVKVVSIIFIVVGVLGLKLSGSGN